MLQLIVYPLIMAMANRWRGGAKPLLPGEVHGGANDHKRTQVRRLAFALAAGLLAWNPWVALVAYISCLTGWGFPVSAAIGARGKLDYEDEFAPLDAIAHFLASTRVGGYTSTYYGVAWLTLHGLLFGGLAALAMASPFPLLWAGMGFCYYLAKDWERGELYDGALKGLGIALALLHTFNQ